MNPKMTPIANIGDLVTLAGYANRLFRIDSYTHEFTFERGIEMEEIYYDCTCVTGGEYNLGAQEDITVVCRDGQTEAFLQTYEHPIIDNVASEIFDNMFGNIFGEGTAVVKPIKSKVTPKKQTKQQRIDELLDEMINVNTAVSVIGDSDGGYRERIDEITKELTAITEGR